MLKVIHFGFAWKVIRVFLYFIFVFFKKVKTTNVTQTLNKKNVSTHKTCKWLCYQFNFLFVRDKEYVLVRTSRASTVAIKSNFDISKL